MPFWVMDPSHGWAVNTHKRQFCHEVSWGDHKDGDLGAMPSCKDDETLFVAAEKNWVVATQIFFIFTSIWGRFPF